MSVGDVNSNARGSGARYNDGKAPLQLIPLSLIADSLCDAQLKALGSETACALAELGDFQTTHEIAALDRSIGNLHDYWRDCAAVFDYGRKKYAEWNWAKGMAWSIPLACAARHALAILEGETTDPESGLPHVGHLLCNLVMLRTFVTTYPEGNDLPPAHLFDDRRPVIGGYHAEEHHAVEAPMPPTVDFVVHSTMRSGDFEIVPAGPRPLKVGDRVRTTRGGYTFGPQSGVIVEHVPNLYTVRVDELHPDMCGERNWSYWPSELTPDDPLAQPLIQN